MGLPFIALLLGAASTLLTAGAITVAFVTSLNALLSHLSNGTLSEDDKKRLGEIQESLDSFLKSLYDISDNAALPRSDIIVPSSEKNPFRIPVKIQGSGLRGGSGNAQFSGYSVIVTNPEGEVIWKNGKDIINWPANVTVPEFCGPSPWIRWLGPDDRDPMGGALPVSAAAGQLVAAPAIVYNRGMAGGISVRDFTSQGLFHIRKFQRSGVVTILNNTDDVLVLGDPFAASATKVVDAEARHGSALATSMYCFPGQSFQVGGVSTGAGVEVTFGITAWSVPRETNVDQDLLAQLRAHDASLDLFMFKAGPVARVGKIYVFVDVPWSGGNRINLLEKSPSDAPPTWEEMAADYTTTENVSYDRSGNRYQLTFTIPKGENPVGKAVLQKK